MLLKSSLRPHLRSLIKASATMSSEVSDVHSRKQAARQLVKISLKTLTESTMSTESLRICEQAMAIPAVMQASYLGVYVHCAKLREVDTSLILRAALAEGKRCYVPVVEDKSSNMKLLHLDAMSALVTVPPYGILEPSQHYDDGTMREDVLESSVHLDVLLMPGLGFDRSGRRLGRGGGYYDKMLTRLQQQAQRANKPPPLLVALSYSLQLLEEVPVDSHDQPVDLLIVADEEIIICTDRGKAALSGEGAKCMGASCFSNPL